MKLHLSISLQLTPHLFYHCFKASSPFPNCTCF